MSVTYWVAKNVEDVFRNESRNVGVLVQKDTDIAARFVGERDNGALDRRLLGQRFSHPEIYLQWLDYWRSAVNNKKVSQAVAARTANYFVVEGGQLTDTGSDTAEKICAFLYSLLVAEETVMDAFELSIEADSTQGLGAEMTTAFSEFDLLADTARFNIRHPIKRDDLVRGKHIEHRPSFSQRNGKLYIYEAIDFTTKRPKLIRERAGWMAYMYTDLKQQDQSTETYSIYRPGLNEGVDVIDYAKAMLGGESKLINWNDDNQRKLFLNERQRIAEAA